MEALFYLFQNRGITGGIRAIVDLASLDGSKDSY
jgi:hypothetical protein